MHDHARGSPLLDAARPERSGDPTADLVRELRNFRWHERPTERLTTRVSLGDGREIHVETFVNEFWTSRQRAAHSLHEISYRACFKPQLPRFFIERLTAPGDVVYDPFMGRGTTVLEAGLHGRVPLGCDINPLSRALVSPRLSPPTLDEVEQALDRVDFQRAEEGPPDLLAFYHSETLREICSLRRHLVSLTESGELPPAEAWLRMVALNRLTGHSSGFFSVYTLPPNQALSAASQRKINTRREQQPPRRDVPVLILAKSRSLLQDCDQPSRDRLARVARDARLFVGDAARTPHVSNGAVDLVVTSPPFLDVVDYARDNWLRCWFCGIDADRVAVTLVRRLDTWEAFVVEVFRELRRIVCRGGHVAFEVGEVRGGQLRLEESVVRCAVAAGMTPVLVLVNDQRFTKTANCWGVANNRKGTNTNRVVLLRRD
jgi:hypothetical protein